jgi:hypothetical protein
MDASPGSDVAQNLAALFVQARVSGKRSGLEGGAHPWLNVLRRDSSRANASGLRAPGPFLGSGTEDGCFPDLSKCVEQGFLAVTVACALCAKMEKSGEQIGDHAHEDVHVNLLVGPVVLRPKHHVHGILEMSEDRLDVGL